MHPRSHLDVVVGSGVPTCRELGLGGVRALVVESGFTVRVAIGEPEKATVEVDDNIADLVEIRLTGSVFHLGLRPGAQVQEATLSADVTLSALDHVTVGGESRMTFVPELAGQALVLTVLGMSEIGGTIQIEQVRAGASGASRLALTGEVRRLVVAASGASELELSRLVVADLDITLSGASVADVTVDDALAAEVGGASVLRYAGNPQIVRQQATGASTIGRARS
ncbi:MAG: GIN domain-containing protein [Pseudonocardia sp.]